MRTFVAVELPLALKERLQQLQKDVQQALGENIVRWTKPENLHLTLRFLGATSDEQRAAVISDLRRITGSQAPIPLSLQGLGSFPNPRHPKILWIGFGGSLDALARLQSQIEAAVQNAGFDPETRPFSPHLTIGRVKRSASSSQIRTAGEKFQAYAQSLGNDYLFGEFSVEEIVYMHSKLGPGGPVYTALGRFPLGG